MDLLKIFHVVVDTSTAELEAIQTIKPPRLLLSYFYFKNKPLKEYFKKIGYIPQEIIFDSGAYSAMTKKKHIALTAYLDYIIHAKNDHPNIRFINLDVIGDHQLSFDYFLILKRKGLQPLPVIHYSEDYKKWLEKYLAYGENFIALGGTVPIKNKQLIADWIKEINREYPHVNLHLLGSSSKKILSQCQLFSCDSSTWFKMAINGYPKLIEGNTREAKIERAKLNLLEEMEKRKWDILQKKI